MRDKGSEWRALKKIRERGPLSFTPLVEAVCEPYMPSYGGVPKSPVAVLSALGDKLAILGRSSRVWYDLGHLLYVFSANDVAEFHRLVLTRVGSASGLVTPVVRTSSPSVVTEAAIMWARDEHSGLCIRVDGATHLSKNAQVVQDILATSGLPASELDLIFDAQDLPNAVAHEALRDFFPLSDTTRTWAVIAGSFPKSITDMSPDEYEHTRDRSEWLSWRDEILQAGTWRRPMYGDYATQPAIYIPSPSFPGSPSVRYTCSEQYVVLRGRGGSGASGADFGQYIGHALYLRQQSYFCDVLTTPGDAYVERIAELVNGTGNLTTWRIASIERHLQVVNAQMLRFAPVLSR